jgi:hypothetical protein
VTHLSAIARCGCFIVLSGCAVTREGTLTRIPSGPTIPVSVSVQEESATVVGTDPGTGERLEGTFHVNREQRGSGPGGNVEPWPPMGGGAISPGVAPPLPTGRRATIQMVGRLEGDKGTNLKCVLEIEKRVKIRGSGTCRPVESDDLNPTYRLRF